VQRYLIGNICLLFSILISFVDLILKYERLAQEELEKLQDDFVNFLVVNGITADDWVSIKENEPLNADQIVEQFSDVIWEGVLRKVEYLDKIEAESSYFFRCEEKEIHLIRVIKNGEKLATQTASKPYSKIRELELYDMIKNGCVISKGEQFISLNQKS
jgi:hypothetical protein